MPLVFNVPRRLQNGQVVANVGGKNLLFDNADNPAGEVLKAPVFNLEGPETTNPIKGLPGPALGKGQANYAGQATLQANKGPAGEVLTAPVWNLENDELDYGQARAAKPVANQKGPGEVLKAPGPMF